MIPNTIARAAMTALVVVCSRTVPTTVTILFVVSLAQFGSVRGFPGMSEHTSRVRWPTTTVGGPGGEPGARMSARRRRRDQGSDALATRTQPSARYARARSRETSSPTTTVWPW